MSDKYITGLKKARQDACLTQEQAAELAEVSLESWKAYEYGQRIPPNETVVRICEALEAPWLALEYLKISTETLGVIPLGVPTQELPTAVITLINRVFAFADHHRDRQLLAIAEDGLIDENEQETFEDIVEDLDGIIGAALAVKYPQGAIKRENRPDGGTSKRLRVPSKDENNCKDIISHRPRIARPNLARRGGAAL